MEEKDPQQEWKLHMDAKPKVSLMYWYDKTRGLFPSPRTEIWQLPAVSRPSDLVDLVDHPQKYIKSMEIPIKKIGYPVFVRTDLSSAKHHWDSSCVIHSRGEIGPKVARTVEDTLMKDMFGEMVPVALVFREFLPSISYFKAFQGFPVTTELRMFMKGGRVSCVHRYWPKVVFEQDRWAARTIPRDWLYLWEKTYSIPKGSIDDLITDVDTKFPNSLKADNWSMDFFRSRGTWYLTDMAIAEVSYHVDHKDDLLYAL